MNIADAETQSVVIEREMAHAPEKVWRALTEGHLIAEWLMANDFAPVTGRKFTFRSEPQPHWNGVVDSEVLEVEPGRKLVYRWDASGDEAAAGFKTIVTWTLTPTTTGVRVRMEQSGFKPQHKFNRDGAAYGWQRNLDGLDRVAATLS
jgi:uncharacterized protein YndB with AHSA1/START domain